MRGPTPDYGRPVNRGAQMLIKRLDGRSQRSVARELRLSPTHFNHLLHGRRLPSRTVAVLISRRLKVPVVAWGQRALGRKKG